MENLTKPINLSQISYPVFRLGTSQPTTIEGVVMYARLYLLESGEEIHKYYVVDDKSIPAPTLAKRRLKLMSMQVNLKKLGRAVFFLGDLVKLTDPRTWLIDSAGLVFQYKKTERVKLTFKKITKIHRIPTGGAILEVEGIASRFKCLFAPNPTEQFAGILKMGLSYVLYGVYDTKHDDTWRMV